MKKIFLIFLFSCWVSCHQRTNNNGTNKDNVGVGGNESGVNTVVIVGGVQADPSFEEQSPETGRMITGRIITGRILTARSPVFVRQDNRRRVAGALVSIEELGKSTESDSNGNFSLPVSLSGCPCKLTLSVKAVRKDGKSYKVRQTIEITPEDIKRGKVDLGDIQVYATGGVAGRVKLKNSDNSMGVYVYVPGTPMISITDEDGYFVMGDIPPGEYNFVIEKYGYESKSTDNVQVEAGSIKFIGDFELSPKEQGFKRGKVVDQDKNPISGAFIISDAGRAAISDKYGVFKISEDTKMITVGREGYQSVVTTMDDGIEIILMSDNIRFGAIKGRVYNWMTTKPVSGVSVILIPSGNIAVSSNDGSFVIEDVPPGNYTIMFIRSDYEIGIEVVSLISGRVIDLGILGLLPECVMAKFYRDSDGDGFGDSGDYVEDCYAPSGYVGNANDCDDSDVSVHPGSAEVCNGQDDNCNDMVDEGVSITFYRDADGDRYGNPNSTTRACSAPSGYVLNNLDCNDGDISIKPTATEICDNVDQDCDGLKNNGILSYYYRDGDGDGQGYVGSSTLGCVDSSNKLRDIYGNEIGGSWSENSLDCDDSKSNIRFGINETKCDGIDENCNGIIDDGVLTTFYRDADGDGYGNPNSTTQACSYPSGYTSDRTDCNDTNPNFNPGVTEVVDGQDENCDGIVDNLNFKWSIISTLSPSRYIDIAVDSSDNLYVAFNYTAYGSSRWLAYLNKIGRVWSSEKTFYLGSGNEIYNCSIEVSPDGATSYFAFSVSDSSKCGSYGVCVTSYSNSSGSWGPEKNLNINGMFVSLKYLEGISHIVYSTGSSVVHTYASPSTPNFSLSSVVTSDAGSGITDIDIAISPNGATVHIVFARKEGGVFYPYYTRNITNNDFSGWLTPVALSTYTYDVKSVGIAVAPDGSTHVCFTGDNTPRLLYTKNGATPFTIDSEGPMSSCSIVVDKNGNPHIVYYSKALGEFRYATQWSGVWRKYKVANVSSSYQNKAAGIIIDSKGFPQIVFILNGFAAYATVYPAR